MKSLVWFQQDLRLADNPALNAAAELGEILLIYILDGADLSESAHQVWLFNSLQKMNITAYTGNTIKVMQKLFERNKPTHLFWNSIPYRDYDEVIALASRCGVQTQSYESVTLWAPNEVLKPDRTPYRVFTPFYKQALKQDISEPVPAPHRLNIVPNLLQDHLFELTPAKWHSKILESWNIGKDSAKTRLNEFIAHGLTGYKEGRNYPNKPHVSQLSPYIHFGEISIRTIWHKVLEQQSINNIPKEDTDHFLSELGWREFSYYLLYHFPEIKTQNFQPKFEAFPWRYDEVLFKKWTKGQTGYPIIDAGMRQLWQTGYIHNRVRMIVASFLVKNLLIHWHYGRDWFAKCLVDADEANNNASWQWVAGSGADAAPYYRIFSPIVQAQKFDPDGGYIKRFVPELAALPAEYLSAPWLTPQHILRETGIILGLTYPSPIVDFSTSRDEAVQAYTKIKGPATDEHKALKNNSFALN